MPQLYDRIENKAGSSTDLFEVFLVLAIYVIFLISAGGFVRFKSTRAGNYRHFAPKRNWLHYPRWRDVLFIQDSDISGKYYL